jgi:hypothetical protein
MSTPKKTDKKPTTAIKDLSKKKKGELSEEELLKISGGTSLSIGGGAHKSDEVSPGGFGGD